MKRIGPQISDRSYEQLAALSALFEGQRAALERAIGDAYGRYIDISDVDRLRRGATDVPCASCQNPIAPHSHWMPGLYGEAFCEKCQSPQPE